MTKLTMFLLIAFAAVACAKESAEPAPEPAAKATAGAARTASATRVSFSVKGMTCSSCVEGITKALNKSPGVESASVDFAANRADVTFDPTKTDTAAVGKVIEGKGYQVSVIETAAAAAADDTSCGSPEGHAMAGDVEPLTDAQVDKVASYIVDKMTSGEAGGTLDVEEVARVTGVTLEEGHRPAVVAAVKVKLKDHPMGQALLEGENRCSEYGACSLHGNLSYATGETLDMYVREKAEDGQTFDSFALPAFDAVTLAGDKVSSADLRGKPVVLAFFAVHCSHSMKSLAIMQHLHRTYSAKGVQVVAVYVNSGTVDDLNTWLPDYASPEYPVWSVDGASLGDDIGSHLVPTYLLVTPDGQVKQKLVGFKEQPIVVERVEELLAARG